jgi:transcriptional regulator with XRE-family HTH domain
MSISARVKKRRAELGISLRDMASRCGLSFSTLSRIENGRFSPTYENAAKLAKALELDVAEIAPELTGLHVPSRQRSPERSNLVSNVNLRLQEIPAGARRDLSKVASRSAYEAAYLVSGRLQLRSSTGFRQTLAPGAMINGELLAQQTYLGIAVEPVALLWIGPLVPKVDRRRSGGA